MSCRTGHPQAAALPHVPIARTDAMAALIDDAQRDTMMGAKTAYGPATFLLHMAHGLLTAGREEPSKARVDEGARQSYAAASLLAASALTGRSELQTLSLALGTLLLDGCGSYGSARLAAQQALPPDPPLAVTDVLERVERALPGARRTIAAAQQRDVDPVTQGRDACVEHLWGVVTRSIEAAVSDRPKHAAYEARAACYAGAVAALTSYAPERAAGLAAAALAFTAAEGMLLAHAFRQAAIAENVPVAWHDVRRLSDIFGGPAEEALALYEIPFTLAPKGGAS